MSLKQDTIGVIQQVCDLLQRLDDEQFAQQLKVYSGSTIGAHIRHIYGFYDCLIKGEKQGMVNYDQRVRNPRIETETSYCDQSFCDLVTHIEALDLAKNIRVTEGMSLNENTHYYASSVGRELMFLQGHTIHHLAIVKMGLRVHFPEFKVDKNLGVAPSTIAYQQANVSAKCGK